MTDTLVVLMGDRVAGTLTRAAGGRLTFAYDDAYRAEPNATPLSVSMPIPIRRHGHATIEPWLAGLLPDNSDVRARWSRRYQVANTPFGLLSSPVGLDCAGAVRFVPPDGLDAALTRPGTVEWLTDAEIAARIRALRRDTTAWLGEDFTGRFSLAGAQAKMALLYEDGRWGLPSGAAATSHILKPAVTGVDDHDLNEHLCSSAARHAGLRAVRSRVLAFGDESVIAVERYDRLRSGARPLLRVHQEDTCQALGRPPTAKYQSDGGPGPREIADLFRRHMPAGAANLAVGSFLDALVFHWVIGGTDAHAKNYSLLLHRDQVRFAPLYDVASMLPYTHERQLKLAMRVGSDYRLHVIRANAFVDLAADIRLDPDEVLRRAGALTARIPDAFSDAAAELGDRTDSPLPARLVDAVAQRAARCARAFPTPSPPR